MTESERTILRLEPPAPQRVLVMASELPPGPGGIGTHAHAISIGLAAHGREVELLGCQNYSSPDEVSRFNERSTVSITRLVDHRTVARRAAARRAQLARAVNRFRPDVIVASGGRVLWLVASVAAMRKVPWVAVVHGTELGGSRWNRVITRYCLNRASEVIAVSRFTALLTAELGVTRPIVRVIHNGGDAARFFPDAARGQAFRQRYGLGGGPILLTVGNITERKGQWQVVEAMPAVLRSVPDATYVLVGIPTDAEALARRAAELGISRHVVALGQLDAESVEDAYRAADVFTLTSVSTASGDVEGFGVAVAEAALSGMPSVVTRGSGVEETLEHGVTALVVNPTSRSIAEGLVALLGDRAGSQAMGEQARRRALAEGTWTLRSEEYGEVLDGVDATSPPRMVVISHTEYHRTADGSLVGFGPTVRELDHLATLSSQLVHVAPLHAGPPTGAALAHTSDRVRIVPVRPAGGPRPVDRLLALRAVPGWIRAIDRELRGADVVHVRAPAGISMVALCLLTLRRRPRHRWVKYGGDWSPIERDAATYRAQRWWLKRGWARAEVTVNGQWPDQPSWIHAFDNPTLTDDERTRGRDGFEQRCGGPPFRAVFVGRLEPDKGVTTSVSVVEELQQRGIDVTLDIVGDGSLGKELAEQLSDLSSSGVQLHGWLERREVEHYLARSHVLLLPTSTEGFPKVVAEAMAFGCVPITSGVSAMGQILGETGGAVVVAPDESWADAVERVLTDGSMDRLARQGIDAAGRFTYSSYLSRVRQLARVRWHRVL